MNPHDLIKQIEHDSKIFMNTIRSMELISLNLNDKTIEALTLYLICSLSKRYS